MTAATTTIELAPPPVLDLVAVGDRIEALLDVTRASPDQRSYERAEELVRLLTDLYGGALARVVELLGEEAPAAMDRLLADELVSSLLLVHDLHPESLAVRVEAALDSVRPLLAGHGGDVELLDVDVDASAVHLRLLGSCDGCPSSASTLQHAVEEAIYAAAPEVAIIDVDEATETPAGPGAVPVVLGAKPVYESCPAEPEAP
ncbi:MAG: NifU family protein [Acidimicrobiales bacterium]